jgi:hypothetical protein
MTTKTQNKRTQTSVPRVGFEPRNHSVRAGEDGSCPRQRSHCERWTCNYDMEICGSSTRNISAQDICPSFSPSFCQPPPLVTFTSRDEMVIYEWTVSLISQLHVLNSCLILWISLLFLCFQHIYIFIMSFLLKAYSRFTLWMLLLRIEKSRNEFLFNNLHKYTLSQSWSHYIESTSFFSCFTLHIRRIDKSFK